MAKILIVDDMAINRELFRDVLGLEGFEVLEASNGDSAIDVARREMPDLILMDVTLPLKDGYSITKEIKADPRLTGIPVVFVSGHSMEELKRRVVDAGGAGYITKPIEIDEFLARVQFYLNCPQPMTGLD